MRIIKQLQNCCVLLNATIDYKDTEQINIFFLTFRGDLKIQNINNKEDINARYL